MVTIMVLIFLLLDFVALDDITTGNEPNFLGEYVTLAVSVVVFVMVGGMLLKKREI